MPPSRIAVTKLSILFSLNSIVLKRCANKKVKMGKAKSDSQISYINLKTILHDTPTVIKTLNYTQ